MSTEELRKAVEALRFIPGVDYETFGAIWKAMRDQEAKIARLRSESELRFAQSQAHVRTALSYRDRAENADALLRECLQWIPRGLLTRITAHLGAEQ